MNRQCVLVAVVTCLATMSITSVLAAPREIEEFCFQKRLSMRSFFRFPHINRCERGCESRAAVCTLRPELGGDTCRINAGEPP